MKRFEMKSFLKELNKDEFVKMCGIPLGYKATFPIIRKKFDKVFLVIPFNKTQKSKTPGVSAVLPVAYTVTFELHAIMSIPEQIKEMGFSTAIPVGFETLRYSDKFENIPFEKPIDVFPHKELKEIGKEEYKAKVEKIYAAYDAVINDLLGIDKASGIDKVEFKQTLNLLLPPVTKQLYKLIDAEFYDSYLEAK